MQYNKFHRYLPAKDIIKCPSQALSKPAEPQCRNSAVTMSIHWFMPDIRGKQASFGNKVLETVLGL